MKLIILLTLISSTAFSMGQKMPKPSPNDPQYVVYGLQAEKQKQDQWCAAAAARMMMSSKTKSLPSQCEIVEKTLKRSCINTPINTDVALRAYGYNAKRVAPDFDLVVREIKQGRPVTIYHYLGGQSGHASVAYGTFYKGRDYLLVYDPFYGRVETWDSSYLVGNLSWYAQVLIK